MLIEFSFANYRSFRDMQRFSMLAAPKRANDSGLEETNVFSSNGARVLKTKGIYGLNASGKSNLVKAFSVLQSMVTKSVADENLPGRIWEDRFRLLINWDDQPMFFQLIFRSADNIYRYGFQIKNGTVNSEWLFLREGNKESRYFSRTEEGVSVTDQFHSGKEFANLFLTGNHEIFRSDSLFLTGAALMGDVVAKEVREAIRHIHIMNGVTDKWSQEITKRILLHGDEYYKNILAELMRSAETGTQRLMIDSEEQEKAGDDRASPLSSKRIVSTKSRYDEEGNIIDSVKDYITAWESEGTQKWLYTCVVILDTLLTDDTLIIDEFDARFHPNLTLKIVNLFNNPKTNPHNAQLIFATHDTGLLRRAKLRRDQICFVDKDKYGVSTMKTLIEFKGVRKDESYEKEYLEGSYGAIAYLDDIDNIIVNFLRKEDGLSATK